METSSIMQSGKFSNMPASLASKTQSLDSHGMFKWRPLNGNFNRAASEIVDSKTRESEFRRVNILRRDTETANEALLQEFSHTAKRLRSEDLLLSSIPKQESTIPCLDSISMMQSLRNDVQHLVSPKNGNSFSHSAKNNSWVSSQLPSPRSYNPLDEPSPLGLKLKKSPSLLELISMSVAADSCGARTEVAPSSDEMQGFAKSKDAVTLPPDKLKASNFPAAALKIGSWECYSRYEGDLVAKCYYAKRKLVWEVLENGLKSKIEIQWSDITSIKASCPENEPGTLEIEMSRPPLFFRELNPQPRKHTLWQTTSDFTGGEATISRCHCLQFLEGVLNRHYEKLLQCDPRLKALAREITPSKGGQNEKQGISCQLFKCEPAETLLQDEKQELSHLSQNNMRTTSEDVASAAKLTPKLELGVQSSVRTPSPNSVIDARTGEETGSSDGDFCVKDDYSSAFHSEGTSFVTSHIRQNNSEHKSLSCSFQLAGDNTRILERNVLDEIAQVLLGESLLPIASREEAFALATKVHALSASLAQDVQHSTPLSTRENFAVDSFPESYASMYLPGIPESNQAPHFVREDDMEDVKPWREKNVKWELSAVIDNHSDPSKAWLTKSNSAIDLLLNFPRIASLPHFFDPQPQMPF